MVNFDLNQFKVVDLSPDDTKSRKRMEIADQLNNSGIDRPLLLQYLVHLGLHPTGKNSIIQGKLPETATDESLDNVA